MELEDALIADRPYNLQVIGKSRVFAVEKVLRKWKKTKAISKTFLLKKCGADTPVRIFDIREPRQPDQGLKPMSC
jgi:hypothetical protein